MRTLQAGVIYIGKNRIFISPYFPSFITYKMRILVVTDFWTKAKLEMNVSETWKPFRHSAWDINMAHAVCRIQGFLSAEAALQGDKHVQNDSCVFREEKNET